MTNLPDPAIDATEQMRLALLDGAPGDTLKAAVTLLCDIPGAVYADPTFQRRYVISDGGKTTVNWPRLGFDLLAGDDDLPMGEQARAFLLLAASMGADHGVRVSLGALLRILDGRSLSLLLGALQHAGGVW